jgi:catechol 2,3-dioxygenase-like lactoylglutathione lyase family enzyme
VLATGRKEILMTSTQLNSDAATESSRSTAVPMRLEVVVVPVADVDRAKSFYTGLGWRLDNDAGGGNYRVVQLTPSGSSASIIFGSGVTADEPGSIDSLLLAVDDIEVACHELRSHGVDVSEVFHDPRGGLGGGWHPGTEGRAAGPDPQGRSYASYASFFDPDGNKWLLQEITQRLPGRVEPTGVDALAPLLHETSEHHDRFEKAATPHDWWDWYAAYLRAREQGLAPGEADAAADRYMAEVKNVVVAAN